MGGVRGLFLVSLEPAERAGGRDPLEPGGRPGPDPQGFVRRRRSSTTSCPTPGGWTPSPTCSWLQIKSNLGRAVQLQELWPEEPLLDQETLHVSVPGLAGWAGGKTDARGVRGRGRLFVRRGPLDHPPLPDSAGSGGRFGAVSPRVAIRASLPLSHGDLPGPHQPATSFAGASPKVSGCCLAIFGAWGAGRPLDPRERMGGPPRVLLEALRVTGGSRGFGRTTFDFLVLPPVFLPLRFPASFYLSIHV